MRRYPAFLALALLTLGCAGSARAPAAASSAPSRAVAATCPRLQPVYPAATWERIERPECAGWSSAGLAAVRDQLSTMATTGLVAVVGGRILMEYGDPQVVSYLASVRKSVLSMLYGIYVERGVINLDETLAQVGIDDHGGLTDQEKQATVRHLLMARSGVYHEASNSGDDLASAPPRGSQRPGTYYLYSNWDFNALGTIFEKKTGRNIYDALEEHLARPIGMQEFDRSIHQKSGDLTRSVHPAYHMNLSTRDMARIGYLMLREGKWAGQQILPRAWVKESTSALTRVPEMNPIRRRDGPWGYGYLWWVFDRPELGEAYQGAYSGLGAVGQHILVMPKLDLVVAHKTRPGQDRSVSHNEFVQVLDLLVKARVAVQDRPLDLLLVNGHVLDGAGNPWVKQDVGILGARIAFVGNARDARVTARDTVDVSGLLITPGFVDMHSHAEFDTPHGRAALSFLYQGITTAVIGVDGGGQSNLRETFEEYARRGIALNALSYVGQGAARGAAMGAADRPPTPAEMAAMKAYVRKGMEEGALGLSTGLFYSPGFFATTDEVVELNKVAAEYGGIYDTHDRDLGAAYKGIGYINSTKEGIEIGERAGTPVIFSHFNPQGRHNYGRAPEGARLIEEARARGVNVMAAQHPYNATQSSLSAYAIPRWAAVGGHQAMVRRFDDPAIARRLDVETMEMLEIRGGASKIRFVDERADLNGKTLAQVAEGWRMPVPAAVRRILAVGNASVMNLELYDNENTRYLATKDWMMTCTDGRTPPPGTEIVHPRPYGAFSLKLRAFVLGDSVITLPFAVRSMTSLATTFLGIPDRGLIRSGFYADLAVFDVARIRDRATYESPHQYSEGTVHVLVNGEFALRDGKPTGVLAGRPVLRGGKTMEPLRP